MRRLLIGIIALLSSFLFFTAVVPNYNSASAQYACNQSCVLNPSGCAAGLSCIGGVCRKAACPSDPSCACPYACNQSCSLGPSGCASPLTCYGTGQVCRNPDCTAETDCTCPNSWVKLKNASYCSASNLNNPIPVSIAAYDADDDVAQRYFVMSSTNYDAGAVVANTIELNGVQPSSKNWAATSTKTTALSPTDFITYVQARKEYNTIANVTDIGTNNYNNTILITSGALTVNDTNKTNFNNRNLVVVVNGNLTFNATTFTPTAAAVAFLATGTITFSATTSEARAIFVAPSINSGTNANLGLKIVGNMAALTTFTNGRQWASGNSRPAVFVVFDQNQYLTLLPYLSVVNYNWQQLK